MPRLNDATVAGMMTQGDQERAQGVPPMWRTYVSVASADDTAAKVAGLGGTVVAEPFDVLDVGRMAVFLDPEQALVAAAAPQHVGAGIVDDPGAYCWSELITRDLAEPEVLHGLFGWEADDTPGYTEWKVDDRAVGGMLPITPEMGGMPPCWTTYFAVDDCDASADRDATGRGARRPRDIPDVGRFAVVADPQGAVFAIITMSPAHEPSA